MFCSKCGTELSGGLEFCPKCGQKIESSAEGQNTANQHTENNPGYTQAVVTSTGTGPLIMGILGLFGGFIPVVKYITGLLSLLAIFMGVSQRKKLKTAGLPTGKATAGVVLGTIAVLITVVTIAVSAMIVGSIGSLFSNKNTSKVNSEPVTIAEKFSEVTEIDYISTEIISFTEEDKNNAVSFTFAQMFYAYFGISKKKPNSDQIGRFIEEVYANELNYGWQNNDFERNRVYQKADKDIQEGINNFSKETIYLYKKKSRLGDYIFGANGFFMENIDHLSWKSGEGLLGSYDLVFPRAIDFNIFYMNEEEAEAYLNLRGKDIGLIYYFKIGELDGNFKKYSGNILSSNLINGVLLGVEVWDMVKNEKLGELTKINVRSE